MKKKIAITLIIVSLIFLAGGIYIITTIESATTELNYLIMLHQVEILREHLLFQIKKVQSDLILHDSQNTRSMDVVVSNVRNLEKMTNTCFDCHHSENVLEELNGLIREIGQYKVSLSRYLTLKAGHSRVAFEQTAAFRSTEGLALQVNDMVHMASAKLYGKTENSLRDIYRSKIILYLLVVITPFIAAGLSYFYIRQFAKPVSMLLKATRKLKGGDLDYRIEGLTDEFGEVATSFNQMSNSLKEHVQKIQQSETRYRMLFESAGDAIFIMEAEGKQVGKIVAANRAAAKMHGYTVDELLQLGIQDLDTPDAAKLVSARAKRILAGGWLKTEINHRKKDGTVFPVELSAGLLDLDDHKYILAFDRDITERKRMENLLLQSKLEWEETFDTITDMITIHDRDFNIMRANKAAQKILKLPLLEEMKVKCYQYYHGKTCPPEECRSCESMETGEPVEFEMYEPHLDMFLEIRAIPRFDDDNRLQGLIHVIRDITERKRVEDSLQRAEQMKMVGEWATTLAHEIKNPLAGIKVSVEVLLDELNLSQEDREVIYKAVEEIKRIELLLKSLLNFAKPPKPQLGATDINDLLDKTIAFSLKHPSLSLDTRSAVSILKEFDGRLPVALADPMQLQQVFLNLLFNGIEAMPDGGQLGIRTFYDTELKTVRIEISDSGVGIAKEKMDRIFRPFITTKKKGSGLGLAISRRLVEQHGGEIAVKSQTGKGAVFKIVLPVQEVIKEAADEKQG